MLTPFGGVKVIRNDSLLIGPFEDWSQVRSPGRARRRRKKHAQRIRYYHKPDPALYRMGDTVIGHTATIDQLLKELDRRNEARRFEAGDMSVAPWVG